MSGIQPLPDTQGVGFTSYVPQNLDGYAYRSVGRYHNYHFTQSNFEWPEEPLPEQSDYVIDAFSPTLNKHLHVGHLRNLAIAKSLSQISQAQFVSFLGCSLGVKEGAVEELQSWFDFLSYKPVVYRDTEVSALHPVEGTPGEGEYEGCLVYAGTKHPTVLRRSDGRTTYAYHDLAFAKVVSPTHYLTGSEQFEHFTNLGLGNKHLPMGLVLDPKTGKKMKSRDGNALEASQALQLVVDRLKDTDHPRQLAWNVLAWNFLRVNRSKDVAFDVDLWTQSEAPGLYITYTFARLDSALAGIPTMSGQSYSDFDLQVVGYCAYLTYYLRKAMETMDPSPIANYAHALAKKLNLAYGKERIKNGRPSFQQAMQQGNNTLKKCIDYLGMFPLSRV